MGKYCCFFDPRKDYTEKELTDVCPVCGKTYGFVLEHDNTPDEIHNNSEVYKVERPIGRGFYGATYLCERQTRLRKKQQVLLKVIPVKIYEVFGKNFYDECEKHAEVAEHTEHLVQILDAFDSDIIFGTESINCHVAVLQFIEGEILADYIEDDNNTQTRAYAQIAIDLLKLWNELFLKGEYHNDLHLGNLIVEHLDDSVQRVDAIHEKIRLVAIDLNSVADESLSDSEGKRIGDRKYIANHIALLSERIRRKYKSIDSMEDIDYRLIQTLNKISGILGTKAGFVDAPEASELIDMIKEEFKSGISYAPWNKAFTLAKLTDGINAQTLPSCYVPNLLVDPENKWLDEITISGPQLITGMRGCGKTMLLGAIDIHARLMAKETDSHSFENDKYVGIMASCRDLIDIEDIDNTGVCKLLLLFSIQIMRAVRHLKDLFPNRVVQNYFELIGDALTQIFGIDYRKKDINSDIRMERFLTDSSNQIDTFMSEHNLLVTCISAFEILAEAFVSSSDLLANKEVFYLLDDASTRYLTLERISKLLTRILFMSPKCAFKVTTEMQTLYSFKSPGNIEMAHDIRDYQVFDLGANVYNHCRNPKDGIEFLESIIKKRLIACNLQIIRSLADTLGDSSLIDIARNIINTKPAKRKEVYYGATALAALCVGDIGDIIQLFETILSKNENRGFPVNKSIQTQCYQILCSRRMYSLDRREGKLRDYIKAFSEASYKSLMSSGKSIGTANEKIRQYNSLYIRMTSGDIERQKENLRKLIDSGIFVFADGNGWPRAKAGDNDPITQIKLSYRKMFGLSFFIGLGSSDRYELSGHALEEWLENPTKEILLKNAGDVNDEVDELPTNILNNGKEKEKESDLSEIVGDSQQLSLFDLFVSKDENEDIKNSIRNEMSKRITGSTRITKNTGAIKNQIFDCAVIGMGFEERCYESVKRILSGNNRMKKIFLIRYDEKGYSKEIKVALKGFDVEIIDFVDVDKLLLGISSYDSILIDISGLYKPIIFRVIRESIINKKQLTIVHTNAEKYYPLNDDIDSLIKTLKENDVNDAIRFVELMSGLDTGDSGDYINERLLTNSDYDPVRPTALVGFISPKYSRIFSILDKREYDSITLYAAKGSTNRAQLSRTAGDIVMNNYPAVNVICVDTQNIEENYNELLKCYIDLYVDKNYNFEIALTGSKMQAVVAAVFSTVCKTSQCWYVKPSKFDVIHFTEGVGETNWYSINVK